MLAEVADTGLTVSAFVAELIGVDADTVAHLNRGYALAYSFDDTRKLMTQDGACRGSGGALVAVENMYVGTADTASLDLQKHFPGFRGGLGNILDAEIGGLIEDSGFHGIYLQMIDCIQYSIFWSEKQEGVKIY
jgi:hypothetical protein